VSERGRVKVEIGHKRVRVMFSGTVVADTRHPRLVWERPYYPTYYIPAEDVRRELLVATGESEHSPSRGDAHRMTLRVGDRAAEGSVGHRPGSPVADLVDTYVFDWTAMDHWFEEDEEVFVHARDPYKRVDALRSSRHVRVEIDGVEVANSTSGVMLFETSLPPRHYLPKTDVRMDMLVPSRTETACPYKGVARYWSVQTGTSLHPDVVWGYDTPLPESAAIAGLVCFYDERVDVWVDGAAQDRPQTVFS